MEKQTVENEGGYFNRRRAEKVQLMVAFLAGHYDPEPEPYQPELPFEGEPI